MVQYSISYLLKKYKIRAHKNWGQNWLINQEIITKIINVIDLNDQEIVEIGPGLGALTFSLIKIAKSIIAYEIDPIAIEILKSEISQKSLQIYHQNFLTAHFSWQNRKILIGNIPYYITSNIIFKIIQNNHLFSQAILTVQNEVANRLIAPIGSNDYGKLTIAVHLFADVKKHFIIKSQEFYPAPKVDSALVTLNFKKNINFSDHENFLFFVKNCFAFKRKTLFNNLKAFFKNHQQILEIFQKMAIELKIRPQQLSVSEFLKLYQYLGSPKLAKSKNSTPK